MNKTITQYFKNGYQLAIQNLDLYLYAFGFSLLGVLTNLSSGSPIANLMSLVSIIVLFFALGYSTSIPYFLLLRQQGSPLKFSELKSITIQTGKRIMPPFVGVMALCILLLLIYVFTSSVLSNPQNYFVKMGVITQVTQAWSPLYFILNFLSSLLIYFNIYFTVEKNGFFLSTRKSVSFSLNHLSILIAFFLLLSLSYAGHQLLILVFMGPVGIIIATILQTFLAFVCSATALIIYQSEQLAKK